MRDPECLLLVDADSAVIRDQRHAMAVDAIVLKADAADFEAGQVAPLPKTQLPDRTDTEPGNSGYPWSVAIRMEETENKGSETWN